MIRILQCVNRMDRAGLETVLMNYYRHIDREQLQFDFLTHRPDRGAYDDEIEALGGRIFRAPRLYPWNYPAYFAWMRAFFREHPEYTIVHSHIDAMSLLPLLAAKRAGVPIRIAHSHNTSVDRDLKYPLKMWFRYRLPREATHLLACGQKAGEYLFGERPFGILPNGIDVRRFRFDGELRRRARREMGLEGKFVVGHVGRLSYQKNQGFLLKLFAVVARQRDAVLLLAGTGEQERKLHRLAKKQGIEDRVRFLGSREDMPRLYMAMDVFVLPSRFEGVPLVGIEAQSAGLPCFFSDRVPREVVFTKGCRFLPLEASADAWAEAMLSAAGERERVTENPYDIQNTGKELEKYYRALKKEEQP